MAIETPPPITPLDSPAPQRGDRATFFSRVDAFILWFVGAVSQYTALAANVFNNATEAFAAAVRSKDSAAEAKAAAETAVATAVASFFDPERSYARGDCAISMVTFQTYRRRDDGMSTLDPANDVDHWALVTAALTPVASAAQTSAADVKLAAGSAGSQAIAMTERGRAVWLPKANTMRGLGGPVFILRNSGIFPFGIRDSNGLLIAALGPGGTVFVTLEENTSEAGRWNISGNDVEPGLLAMDHTFGATVGMTAISPYYPEFVALDDNTSLHLVPLAAGGFAAVLVDYKGRAVSTPVTVDATIGTKPNRLFKVSPTQAVLFYGTAARQASAVLLNVKGESPALTLSVGGPVAVPLAGLTAAWEGDDGTNADRIVQLSPTMFFYAQTVSAPTGSISCLAMAIVDDKIKVGPATPVTGAANETSSTPSTTSYALSPSTVLVVYPAYNSSNGIIARVVSVSAAGDPACVVGPSYAWNRGYTKTTAVPYSVCVLTPERILVMTDGSSSGNSAIIGLNISGTAISASSAILVSSGPVYPGNGWGQAGTTGDGRYTPRLSRLNSNQALLSLLGYETVDETSGSASVSAVVTFSDGAVTIGPQSYRLFAEGPGGGVGFVIPGATKDFCVAMARPQSRSAGVYGYKVDAVTNAIVPAGAAMLPGIEGLAATELRAARTAKGLYLIHGWGSLGYGRPALAALRAMHVYSPDSAGTPRYRGCVPVPELDDLGASGVGSRQRPRTVAPNRIVTFGIVVRGPDNPYNARLRMLSVELCDLK